MNDTLQFQLALLAFGADVKERLDVIISTAIVQSGYLQASRLSAEKIEAEIGVAPKRKDFLAVQLGAKFSGIKFGSESSCLARHALAEKFIADWKQAGRKTPMVRILKGLVFEARDGKGISYQDFSIVCAVKAAMGSKTHSVVTKPRIRAGMLGYNSGSWLFDENGDLTGDGNGLLQARQDGAQPISPKQLRRALDRLEQRGFFSRFQASRRRVFFSAGKMTAEEIGERLVQRAETKLVKSGRVLELQTKLRALNGKGPLGGPLNEGPLNRRPEDNTEGPLNSVGPLEGHSGATGGPLEGHLMLLNNAASVMRLDNAAMCNASRRERERVEDFEKQAEEAMKPIDYTKAKSLFRSLLAKEGIKL